MEPSSAMPTKMDGGFPTGMDQQDLHDQFSTLHVIQREKPVFMPQRKKADFGQTGFSLTLLKAHNTMLEGAQSLAKEIFLSNGHDSEACFESPKAKKFLGHQFNITLDPVSFVRNKDKQFTKMEIAFDLVVGGPLAALADLATSVFMAVCASLISMAYALLGAYHFVTSGFENTHQLKKAVEMISTIAKSVLIGVHSAVRVVPVVGIFLAYVGSTAAGVCQNAYSEFQARRKEAAQSQMYPSFAAYPSAPFASEYRDRDTV